MGALIREYQPADEEAVVELSLRAWAPVFASIKDVLGPEIFTRLHGDWRQHQGRSVRETLADGETTVWVAEAEGSVIGFIAVTVHSDRPIGEIWMVAVDPDHQTRGTGTDLTEFATDWLSEAGMRLAMIRTGGDPGHAPARRVYQKAGYSAALGVQYFKAL